MKDNFAATNELITFLNKNCGTAMGEPIASLTLDLTDSVSNNCKRMITKITEVQAVITKYDAALAAKLDPELYKKLSTPDLSFMDTFKTAKVSISIIIAAGASIAGVVMINAIKTGALLVTMVTKVGVIATSCVASLALGVLAMGVDMIASAILGAVERSKLNDAIDSLQSAQNDFEPATRLYTKTIYKTEAKLEVLLGIDD